MPLHLPAVNRRLFLQTVGAGAAVLLAGNRAIADPATARSWALLADTHIAADASLLARGVKMSENLTRVWEQVNQRSSQLAGALIHGDCAYLHGLSDDYETFAKLLMPMGTSELPVHFMLGNHDDRDNFRKGLSAHAQDSPLESHHVSRLDAGIANWFLLDSLEKVNSTPGRLGEEQLAWLGRLLDEHADKPALISVHHQPQLPPTEITSGLVDTQALLELLVPRRHVKALIFGHTHVWRVAEHEGIHLVNLPPVAYVFQPNQPNGWVEAELAADRIRLTLHTLDAQHPLQGEIHELSWR